MVKINCYSNILKKGTIIFNCANFVNYCSDKKSTNDPEYQKLLSDYQELGCLNRFVRGAVSIIAEDRKKEENKEEDKGNFFLGLFKQVGNFLMPTVTPISLLNEQMFQPFDNVCDFELDKNNGIHYSFIKKNNNNKYLVFFHGIMDSMNYISDEINSYDNENRIYGTKAYEKVFKDLDYNIILVEYNSILNNEKYESTKKRIEKDSSIKCKDTEINKAAKEYEELYGLDQINDISNLMADTIKRILDGKQIDELVISAHSHGNNYGLEILKKFINEGFHKDKLVYWGCKGYLDIEKTILKAADTFLGTYKNPIDFGNETKLFSKLMKIWNCEDENLDLIAKVVLILKELPIDQLLIFFKLLFYEYYDKIVKENNNEDRLIGMYDNLDIKNYKLSKENHAMKMQDFVDMEKEYKEYIKNKPKDKIPCLLFYADKDEYVGNAFQTNITNTKSTEKIEDLAKAAAQKENKYKTEDLQVTEEVKKEIKKAKDDNEKKIKEIENKIQQAANDNSLKINMNVSKENVETGKKSFLLNIKNNKTSKKEEEEKERIRKEEYKNKKEEPKKEETTTTTTTTKKKYCNYKKQ